MTEQAERWHRLPSSGVIIGSCCCTNGVHSVGNWSFPDKLNELDDEYEAAKARAEAAEAELDKLRQEDLRRQRIMYARLERLEAAEAEAGRLRTIATHLSEQADHGAAEALREAASLLTETRNYAGGLEGLAHVHGADLSAGRELGERLDAFFARYPYLREPTPSGEVTE